MNLNQLFKDVICCSCIEEYGRAYCSFSKASHIVEDEELGMDVNLIWNLRCYKETIKGYTLFIGVIYVSMACFVCLFIDFSSLLLLF